MAAATSSTLQGPPFFGRSGVHFPPGLPIENDCLKVWPGADLLEEAELPPVGGSEVPLLLQPPSICAHWAAEINSLVRVKPNTHTQKYFESCLLFSYIIINSHMDKYVIYNQKTGSELSVL